MRRFSQVNVFSSESYLGNPLAVVHDAQGLSDDEMHRFAHWTNLSETTFLLPPTDPGADYRIRIFTPSEELSFAGHPTLGSAHAWLEAGGVPRVDGEVVQQCPAGLVRVRRGGRLAFAAPPVVREGPVTGEERDRLVRALALSDDDVMDARWIDNGPGWVGVLLRDADAVLAVRPDWTEFGDLEVGVVGRYPAGSECAVEVRAFCPSIGVVEDPVTGSLNASVAQWLLASGRASVPYTASQGTRLRRTGRIFISQDQAGAVWVGGKTSTLFSGESSF